MRKCSIVWAVTMFRIPAWSKEVLMLQIKDIIRDCIALNADGMLSRQPNIQAIEPIVRIVDDNREVMLYDVKMMQVGRYGTSQSYTFDTSSPIPTLIFTVCSEQ